MSFTKVAPAGIGTSPGNSILIGDSLLHSTGIDIGSSTGVGVTIRQHGDATFTGIITASAFFGDGSGLEGVSSSGIGTALNDDDTNILNKIYYVNQELSIGSTVTVNHPDTGTASYTHYQDLVVKNDADFIVADGDTFIPDILGITTSTLAASAATGGRIRAGTITNAGANGAVNFPNGLTGTAGTFTGAISAASASITGAISAASASITGNLGVGGVLTYEDVTNVDSVGVITARSGINLTGGVINSAGNINCTSGRFQRGSATVQDGDAIAGGININGLDMDASVIMSVFGNDGDFTRISGSKSRNASVGSHTIVQNNDVLLSLKGFGSDGTNFEEAAQIEMQVDGSPGNNVMPGRIVFKTTTTDGTAERLRIGSAGQLGIAGANYGTSGQVLTSQGASSAVQWAAAPTWTQESIATVQSGTEYEFTGIPATAREIMIQFNGISFNNGGNLKFILGHSGGYSTSGYNISRSYEPGGNYQKGTNGIEFNGTGSAGYYATGRVHLWYPIHSNEWWVEGTAYPDDNEGQYRHQVTGRGNAGGTLSKIKMTSDNSGTFDNTGNGKVQISYLTY